MSFLADADLGIVNCNPSTSLSCAAQCVITNSLLVTCAPVSFGSLVLSPGSVMNVTVDTPVVVNSSFVAHPTSASFFGGGFGTGAVPFMEVGPSAVVTVQRLLNVYNLSLLGMPSLFPSLSSLIFPSSF